MRSAFAATIALTLAARVSAQQSPAIADSVQRAIEAAVATSDVASAASAVAFAERAVAGDPASRLLRHYHGYALYRLATAELGHEGSGRARPYVERARDVLERLAADSAAPVLPETYALLSAVFGLQIATSRVTPVAAMRFGPKSNEWMARAVAAGPDNPRVYLVRGIGKFNTPSAFGGGVDKAEADLKKAIELFARDDAQPPNPSWGRAEAHVWLGQVYAREKRVDAARAEYEAALRIEPNNVWVRSTLLPALGPAR